EEKSDHGSVDAPERRLQPRAGAQRVPERKDPHEEEKRGQVNRDEADQPAYPPVRGGRHYGPEIGGEGEQRPWHRLRCSGAPRNASLLTQPGGTTACCNSGSTTWPPPKTSAPER